MSFIDVEKDIKDLEKEKERDKLLSEVSKGEKMENVDNEKLQKQIKILRRLKRDYIADKYKFVSSFIEEPDNFQLTIMEKVLNSLIEATEYGTIDIYVVSDLAENETDAFNDLLAKWLINKNSVYYANDVLDEANKEDIFSLLRAAQYKEIRELYDYIYYFLDFD
jgi:hypothetical protein